MKETPDARIDRLIAERDEARADADALAEAVRRMKSLEDLLAVLTHHDALVAKR